MTESDLAIDQCRDSAAWDLFVQSSPQGNIFCRSVFLAALDVEPDLWLVFRNSEPAAGVIVLRRGSSLPRSPYSFTLYHGVLLSAAIAAAPPHERCRALPELLDFMARRLTKRYRALSLCLHYTFPDLRGWQWFNYHQPERGRFKFDLRYTGLLDLPSYKSFENYLATIRPKNRQHYRTAFRAGVTIETSVDISTLDHLHDLTLQRQGIDRRRQEGRLLRAITAAALKQHFGQLLIARETRGEAIAATLFLYDDRCGYSLFAGNHPDYRRTNAGTLLLLENIRQCFDKKLSRVDLCGVNSPQRGDFKTSFNAIPTPYFMATWKAPRHSRPA